MIVRIESSYKTRQSGSYNPPTAAVIMEHSVQFQHHGVKNQHWGIKNGPPYPLTGENKQKAKASYKKPPKNPEKEGDYKPESSSSSGGSSGPKARKDDDRKTIRNRLDKLDKDYDNFDRKVGDRDEWNDDEGKEWKRMESEYTKLHDEVKKYISDNSKYKDAAKKFAQGRSKIDNSKFMSTQTAYKKNNKLLEDVNKTAAEIARELNDGNDHKRLAQIISDHITDEYFKRRKK